MIHEFPQDAKRALGFLKQHGPRSSALALLSATAVDRLALLGIHGVLARLWPTEEFAKFVLAYAVASITARVADGGLAIAAVRGWAAGDDVVQA